MARYLLLLAFLLAPALAQGMALLEAAAAVRSANSLVVFVGSYLRQRVLAEALHGKATSKTASVALVTSPYTYLDGASYWLGLHLAGARLYLGRVEEYLLVVDRTVVFSGRGLGGTGEVRRLEGEEAEKALQLAEKRLREAVPLAVPPENLVEYFWRQR
uniref:Uncharacterized protein n=1 Tax=Thermus caliditerrae TaxID=1330700 RepID=A0A7C5VIP8_9DEIN